MSSPIVVLSAADAGVELVPSIGGAVASFRCDGHDVLRPTPRDAIAAGHVRQCASYPLVPYSNRIARATLRLTDREHALARNFGDHPHSIHGIGWQRSWQVVASGPSSALIAFEHSPDGAGAAAWPFAFRATQAFELSRHGKTAMLATTLTIESRDARPFPFGLGFHPFFPRDADTELAFAADARWDTDDTRLPTQRVALAAESRFDPPRAIAATRLDNVFTGWHRHADVRWPRLRRRATIEADSSLAFLVVFVPDEGDYLAVEPVTHMTDAFNRAAGGEAGTGTLVLEPGASRSCTMRIVFAPLD